MSQMAHTAIYWNMLTRERDYEQLPAEEYFQSAMDFFDKFAEDAAYLWNIFPKMHSL
jgi:hypothetical protein